MESPKVKYIVEPNFVYKLLKSTNKYGSGIIDQPEITFSICQTLVKYFKLSKLVYQLFVDLSETHSIPK